MRLGREIKFHIRTGGIQIDAIPGQYFAQVSPVNDRQRIETIDAGYQTLSLNVRETAGADQEFIIPVFVGNASTCGFDFSHGKAQTFPRDS
jgi:hypothetical protein